MERRHENLELTVATNQREEAVAVDSPRVYFSVVLIAADIRWLISFLNCYGKLFGV